MKDPLDTIARFAGLALICYRAEDPAEHLAELETAAQELEEQMGLPDGWAEELEPRELPS